MRGNQNLFVRKDGNRIHLAVVRPADRRLEAARRGAETLYRGSWGPMASVALITRDGRSWYGDL